MLVLHVRLHLRFTYAALGLKSPAFRKSAVPIVPQLLPMAAQKTSQTGPAFVRNGLLPLDKICVDPDISGWREISPERVQELTEAFYRGEFGMSVTCDVQLMEAESTDNKKLVDDGLATVSALLQCRAARDANPDATPSGDPWPVNLLNIFKVGLSVKVVKYDDAGDKDARFRWNVAKHDVDNNTARWSTAWQKITVAAGLYNKYGDWEKVRNDCQLIYGIGKRQTYNRWIRAASGMSAEVLSELKAYPTMPSGCIFDNSYLVTSTTASRNKLSSDAAKKSFHVFAQYQKDEKDMTTETFINVVCKGLRILEIWRSLILKRYGSVAQNSPALGRVCEHLSAFGGLQSIMACAAAGLNLHGKSEVQQGIPECFLLVQELDKCQAGGLPPPISIPDEVELHRRAEAAKAAAAAEELRKAEEAAKAEAEAKKEAAAKADPDADLNGETEILSLATPISRSPATGAGPSVESFAKDKLDERMSKVHFCNTPDELKTAAAEAMSTQRRVVVLVDGITTEKEAFGTMVDVAKQVWDQYAEGTGASPEAQSKFRIIVLLGSRWDLLDKVAKKAAALFPKWSKFKIQCESRDWQSRNSRPGDAIVMCPAEEVQREPTVIGVKFCKDAFASEGVRLRCNEPGCKWRSCRQGLTGPNEEPADVNEDDKVDLLSAMLAEEAEAGAEDEGDGQGGVPAPGPEAEKVNAGAEDEGDGQGGVPAPGPEAEKVNTMLWPYGRSTGHYHRVVEAVGQSRKASAAVIISSTAHPCHWVACVQQGLDTYVFTRRWSNHSKHHGLALGKRFYWMKS